MTALGARVRDYEIWGLLGEGGMSEVWLAKHSVLAIPVVIKTLRRHASVQDAHDRVLHEARLMARISDPRVVRALDAGVHEGVPYLVEEYVDGIDVDELDRRRREALGVGLPLWFVCEVMRQSCRALHGAHQAGVIHRDVKPSNIFGSPETGVRVGDFGIAQAANVASDEVSGTLHFMAPEQLQGDVCGRVTDVFGAGATAYQLRYGRPPFNHASDTLDPRKCAEFPAPQNPAEGYFQQLLAIMLTKDPGKRARCLATCARHFAMISRAIRPPATRSAHVVDKAQFHVAGCSVTFALGDIAEAQADGIVTSAYEGLRMRTGVGDALRRRGGDAIEQEAMASGIQPLGSCIATRAGALQARHVLHAVGAWNGTSCVGRATQRAFLLADELGLRSLALPALGTGQAGISLELSAKAMMTALRWHLSLGGTRLSNVRVLFDDPQKLRTFLTVAEDALREEDEVPELLDLGLPADVTSVRGDSATHIDVADPSRVISR